MTMPRHLVSLITRGSALIFAAALVACATPAQGDAPTEVDVVSASTFVADVGDDLFLAVVAAELESAEIGRAYVAYLCDGAEVATWLIDADDGESVTLTTADAEVAFSLGDDALSGEVTLADGTPRPFTAVRAVGDAGLYRAEHPVGAPATGALAIGVDHYVGGWIILNNAEQRGALTLGGAVVENPTLDPATGTAQTSVGTLSTVTCIPVCFPGFCTCIPVVHPR